MRLAGDHELQISLAKLLRRLFGSTAAKRSEGLIDHDRRLHIVERGLRIGGKEVVGIVLNAGDVALERGDRDRARKFFTPAPDLVQPGAEHRREGIDVLVPRAVEVAEEEKVIVMERFFLLPLPQVRKTIVGDDNPAGELDECKVDQILLCRLEDTQRPKDHPKNPCLPWLHGCNRVHSVDFPVDIAHRTPVSLGRGKVYEFCQSTGMKHNSIMPIWLPPSETQVG